MMLDRIRRDLEEGLNTFKWAGRFLAKRVKIETLITKVVYDSRKIQKKIDGKYLELGEKIFELRDDKTAIQNSEVSNIISEIESLKKDLDLHLSRAKDLGDDPLENAEHDDALLLPRKTDPKADDN